MRVFALAGAIGIEPTQWESEAQVLPLHQAPSHWLLYITKKHFANDFVDIRQKIMLCGYFFRLLAQFCCKKLQIDVYCISNQF